MSTPQETSKGTPLEAKKQCEWCRELIHVDAVKCPYCQKWRKDVQKDITKNLNWAIASIGCAVVPVLVAIGAKRDRVWQEGGTLFHSGSFSLERFLSSFEGWIVILCTVGWIVCVMNVRQTRQRVNRKKAGGPS